MASRRAAGTLSSAPNHRRPLVENQPVEPELPNRLNKLLEVYRLADVAIGPEIVALQTILFFHGCGENDDR